MSSTLPGRMIHRNAESGKPVHILNRLFYRGKILHAVCKEKVL